MARDYAWLLATVADWLHRSDLTTQIPDFVRLAEGRINRKLNIYAKEIDAPLVSAIGSRFIALPSDFSSPIALQMRQTSSRIDLKQLDPKNLPINDDTNGPITYWAIDGANIAFDRPTDQAYSLRFRYVQSIYLSATTLTNALIDKHPDMYLYGALAQSAPYIRDDQRLSVWKSEFEDILRQVMAEQARSKSAVTMTTEVPFSLNRGINRISDWEY